MIHLDKGIVLEIKPPHGKPFRVEVDKNDKIMTVKTKINTLRPEYKLNTFRLIHNGQTFNKSKTVKHYKLRYGDVLHLEKTCRAPKAKAGSGGENEDTPSGADVGDEDAPICGGDSQKVKDKNTT